MWTDLKIKALRSFLLWGSLQVGAFLLTLIAVTRVIVPILVNNHDTPSLALAGALAALCGLGVTYVAFSIFLDFRRMLRDFNSKE